MKIEVGMWRASIQWLHTQLGKYLNEPKLGTLGNSLGWVHVYLQPNGRLRLSSTLYTTREIALRRRMKYPKNMYINTIELFEER